MQPLTKPKLSKIKCTDDLLITIKVWVEPATRNGWEKIVLYSISTPQRFVFSVFPSWLDAQPKLDSSACPTILPIAGCDEYKLSPKNLSVKWNTKNSHRIWISFAVSNNVISVCFCFFCFLFFVFTLSRYITMEQDTKRVVLMSFIGVFIWNLISAFKMWGFHKIWSNYRWVKNDQFCFLLN